MSRARRGRVWQLVAAWTVTLGALIAFLVLTKLGHAVAGSLSALVTAATGAYSVYLQYQQSRDARTPQLAVEDPGGLVVVCYVRADLDWALWLEDRLKATGFNPRLRQLPSEQNPTVMSIWAKRVAEDARCVLVMSTAALEQAGEAADRQIEAVLDSRATRLRTVVLNAHERSRPLDFRAIREVSSADLRQEEVAWALIEDAVRFCGARSASRRAEGFRAGNVAFPGLNTASAVLPMANPNFVGRSDDLKRLQEELVDEPGGVENRCLALHAMAGMGKTQLAVQFAHGIENFETVWWVHAHQEDSIYADLSSLAQKLGLQPVADQSELLRRLWERLSTAGRWLIVYDNAESEEKLRNLLPPAGDGSILITSQSPNWSTLARSRFRLDHLSRRDAVAMLNRRLPARDEKDLAQIAEQLGWLPLALEQAAAYMSETQCQPNRYLRQLNRQFRETLQAGTPAYYNESASATYRLARELTTKVQPLSGMLLELCGFFSPDAIPRDLFEAPSQIDVLPSDLAAAIRSGTPYDIAISAARSFSLLTVTASSFSMHRVVQKLIRESLALEVRTQRVASAVSMLTRAFPTNPDDPGTWQLSGNLQSHCISVLDEAEEHDLVSIASIRLSRMVGEYQRARGNFEQAQRRLDRTLAQLRNHGENQEELAAIELALARVHFRQADLAEAKEHALSALRLRETVLGDDDPLTAASLLELSQIRLELSEFDAALGNARRSLEIYRNANGASAALTGQSLEVLGIVLWRRGEWSEAEASLAEALRLLTQAFGQDNGITARVRTVYGLVLRDSALGDEQRLTRAEDELEHAHTVLVGAHGADHPDTVSAAIHLADTHRRKAVARQRRRQDPDERWFATACRRIAEEFEQVMRREPLQAKKPGRACGLVRQGHLVNHLGDHVRAREMVQEARGIYIQSYGADHPYVAEALTRLIAIEYDLGNPLEADRAAHEARRIYERHYGTGHPYVLQIDAYLADPAHGGRD